MNNQHRAYYVVPPEHLMDRAEAEVMFGIYPDEAAARTGIRLAEMAIRWRTLDRDMSARLEVFDESWAALAAMPDLLLWLGTLSRHEPDGRGRRARPPITVEEVTTGLEALGFVRRA